MLLGGRCWFVSLRLMALWLVEGLGLDFRWGEGGGVSSILQGPCGWLSEGCGCSWEHFGLVPKRLPLRGKGPKACGQETARSMGDNNPTPRAGQKEPLNLSAPTPSKPVRPQWQVRAGAGPHRPSRPGAFRNQDILEVGVGV